MTTQVTVTPRGRISLQVVQPSPWWQDYNFWTAVGTVGAVVIAVLADGQMCEKFDPVALHWAGTEFTATPNINLLPGQREFVDVLQIEKSQQIGRGDTIGDRELDASEAKFLLVPQISIPRGLVLFDQIRGQSIRAHVVAENASLVTVALTLPPRPRGPVESVELDAHDVCVSDPAGKLSQGWRRHRRDIGIM